MMNCLCTHISIILVFISLVAVQHSEINMKISISWAHKQFATVAHTLFSIYMILTMAVLFKVHNLLYQNYASQSI